MQAIAWHRSTSSKPSSCKSLVASSSRSSTWTEFKNELFDEYGGMNSGSHSSTLERLYVWEKKLYEEVKVIKLYNHAIIASFSANSGLFCCFTCHLTGLINE